MIDLDEKKLENFLLEQGISEYSCKKIAGDCSFRSYYRIDVAKSDERKISNELANYLKQDEKNLILMFAPPKYEDIKPFIEIGALLLKNDLRAPEMFGRDFAEGFLLLEDFGDESFNKSMKKGDLKHEEILYKNSIDCLIKASKIQDLPSEIKKYNHAILFNELMVYVDWYLKFEKNVEFNIDESRKFKEIFFKLFDQLNWQDQSLVLRDYHADNLMFLNSETGIKSVGLLDFQDALIGSSAYDLVSLVEDARRDVDLDLGEKLIEYYLQKNLEVDREKFLTDYKILSLQRNLKILGIFSRMARRNKQESYLKLIPRVVDHVLRRLSSDDIFKDVREFLRDLI